MSKFMKLTVEGNDYYIGFSNRASVLNAERKGFMKALEEFDKAPVEGTAKLLRFGMLEKQPEITVEKCNEIIDKYIEENNTEDEGVNIGAISKFIMEQYFAFSGAPNGKKKIKEIEIVDM